MYFLFPPDDDARSVSFRDCRTCRLDKRLFGRMTSPNRLPALDRSELCLLGSFFGSLASLAGQLSAVLQVLRRYARYFTW